MTGPIAFIVVFGSLIFVHELGHFLAARLTGVKVEEFGFGFPPRLARLGTWRGTAITLNWLPIGGFVRLADETSNAPGSLATKGRWTRTFVHSAGALMNILLAFLLFSATYLLGTLVQVDEPGAGILIIAPGSPAEEAGLEPYDNIVSIAGEPIDSSEEVVALIQERLGQPTEFVIEREGAVLDPISITPRVNAPENEGAVGVSLHLPFARRSYPIWEAVPMGLRTTAITVENIVWAIQAAIRRQFDLQLTGVIGIYTMTAQAAETGLVRVMQFAASLSVNLFLLNLLPLPALDGGKLVFIALEFLRGGRRVAPEKEGLVHAIGMVLLLALMVVITVVDYMRYIG
jgi:regulator of sigma E protease